MLPPPVKRPLQARFFSTTPALLCTVPQVPLPIPVVKLSSLGFGLKPQQPARVVVVVIGVVVVVTIVVVVATGPVVVVVVVTSVVVVVAGGAVVVVVAPPGGQGFGEQLPGPTLRGWFASHAVSATHSPTNAPPTDPQHCFW